MCVYEGGRKEGEEEEGRREKERENSVNPISMSVDLGNCLKVEFELLCGRNYTYSFNKHE